MLGTRDGTSLDNRDGDGVPCFFPDETLLDDEPRCRAVREDCCLPSM